MQKGSDFSHAGDNPAFRIYDSSIVMSTEFLVDTTRSNKQSAILNYQLLSSICCQLIQNPRIIIKIYCQLTQSHRIVNNLLSIDTFKITEFSTYMPRHRQSRLFGQRLWCCSKSFAQFKGLVYCHTILPALV